MGAADEMWGQLTGTGLKVGGGRVSEGSDHFWLHQVEHLAKEHRVRSQRVDEAVREAGYVS